jgi:hypothetical protein
VTSRLGTGKPITFFTVYLSSLYTGNLRECSACHWYAGGCMDFVGRCCLESCIFTSVYVFLYIQNNLLVLCLFYQVCDTLRRKDDIK